MYMYMYIVNWKNTTAYKHNQLNASVSLTLHDEVESCVYMYM